MPVTPTYPGIYIEELPPATHTITGAATSITVFVGYTHPFKTKKFEQAERVLSFAEYEQKFGGLYRSGLFDNDVAYAVYQFFLNDGANAFVIGLRPKYPYANKGEELKDFSGKLVTDLSGEPLTKDAGSVLVEGGTSGVGVLFTSLEPVDLLPMIVTVKQPDLSEQTYDITITYGSRVETYRGVTLTDKKGDQKDPNFIETRINDVSGLAKVSLNPGATAYQLSDGKVSTSVWPTLENENMFAPGDFTPVFREHSSLDKIDIFNLLVLPGIHDYGVLSQGLAFCERKRAFMIVDPPANASADGMDGLLEMEKLTVDMPKSPNGALYFPYLESQDPYTGDTIELPPSGYVAGIYARTDTNRGVWKAPAGLETIVKNATRVADRGRMTDMRQGTLNPKGVNCLRTFPGKGTVVFGARTLVTENEAFKHWRYVPVRRMALFIEQTLYDNLKWVVHEPNDKPLWVAIRTSIESFMLSLFRQQAFQGSTPSQAFQVKCDDQTTTQQDIDNGIVNIIVAFAPLKPAEFVIIKIAQLAGQAQS
ncbi:MAG: phage tail sheath subtilisin-like domain-containing protein [Armatimonadota bacterium]|nr:phage tail sheath subtilisin-like domain-containing protein [Armatimonadota bacterium]